MIALLLFLLPLLGGIITCLIPQNATAKGVSLFVAICIFALAAAGFFYTPQGSQALSINYSWVSTFNANFALQIDGLGTIVCMLCAIVFPVIFLSIWHRNYGSTYYGLMLLAQAGMMGVFMAKDGLLFYFFWELALIPVYFLSSIWGNEHKVKYAFKFFIYTFLGSLLMLAGLIYLNFLEPTHSFAIKDLAAINLPHNTEQWLFWVFFIAFAIKMPIFPFHTWQPDAYEHTNTGTTMVLSSVMVKMGVFASICWLLYMFPNVDVLNLNIVIGLSVFGMLYASFLAMKQNDLKRLIAYSSIAHIGLMSAALFTKIGIGWQGVAVQMFAHGINILGMWMVVEFIEQRTGKRKISELGGLAQSQPTLAIMFVIIALANIALPLTNAFVGEFLMFNALFQYNIWVAAAAGLSIIFAAVYTLRMVQYVLYGQAKTYTNNFAIQPHELAAFGIIIVAIFIMGVYAKPMLTLATDVLQYLR